MVHTVQKRVTAVPVWTPLLGGRVSLIARSRLWSTLLAGWWQRRRALHLRCG